MTQPKTQRLLAFLPFVATLDDATMRFLADASHGYDLIPILCDGLLSACDRHLDRAPRPANACLLCQAEAAGRMTTWKMPYRWLGRWTEPEDTRKASVWIATLRPQDYPTATANQWRLGEWAAGSARRHLGGADDLADPTTAMVFASHLFSTYLAASALDRLLQDQRPDAIFLAEQHSALACTAIGLAQAHALSVVCVDA